MTDIAYDLPASQEQFVAELPGTTKQLAERLGCTESYIWTLVNRLRDRGIEINQDQEGRYYIDDSQLEHRTPTDASRMESATKAAVTREVTEVLSEMEAELKATLERTEPARADGGLRRTEGGTDLIIHRTDDHFGEEVVNENGDVVFDSEIAEERVRTVFNKTQGIVEARRDAGEEFDTAHLLLGGDIVTNESIYEGQAHDIDENLYEQINRAADVYLDQIRYLANEFDTVQVVGQVGNHGELRAANSSNAANADDILYAMMDKVIRASNIDNVTFIHSDATYYVNFNIRSWRAHLRHGHDSSLEHIGTSAGKQRWLSWLVDHGFDIAFRGHYHMLKEEPINGVPVLMGGSVVPQTGFQESQAISGRAMAAVHGASDNYPVDWTERIYFG